MPDWSYRTLFQPLLFSLSAEAGRDLALGAMGRLGRLPLGGTVIDLMGHMRPDARLETKLGNQLIASPVVLGHLVDPHGIATAALARFGVGAIEVGPIAVQSIPPTHPTRRLDADQSISIPEASGDSVDEWIARLSRLPRQSTVVMARLAVASNTSADQATTECLQMQAQLAPYVDDFILSTADEALRSQWASEAWRLHLASQVESARAVDRPVSLSIRADLDETQLRYVVEPAVAAGCQAVIVEARVSNPVGGWIVGHVAAGAVRETIRRLREVFGSTIRLVAGSAHEPIEAIELQDAGANGVLIDTGLVYSGPGLPKRINEAVLYEKLARSAARPSSTVDLPRSSIPIQKMTWFWTCVLGTAMLLGGALAFGIASTRVMLPYDEVFIGMSRQDLALINPRLMAFLQHDRVCLSGTMFAIAVFYLSLSWFGIRQGMHWAMVTVLVSAFVGFVSFFWFLGFGYFDPFHAFVTAIMFQFLLLAWQGELGGLQVTTPPNLRETAAWRLAQWGQLLFVVHGVALLVAGVVISAIGCTSVFVREDLQFMDVCPSDLSLANPRLIPLIAHDRASFGGMLMTTGLVTLLTALWGFRQGMRWQWWMLLLAGLPAYGLAIGVHLIVGYTNWRHLAPAYAGLSALILGLLLLWPWLSRDDVSHRAEWNRLLSS